MSQTDPLQCRRALREIGEIAAVAVLPGSQMTEQEALQSIAAIADWIDEDASRDGAECGRIVHRLHAMTEVVELDCLDDQSAIALFDAVVATLRASRSQPPLGGADLPGP